MPGQQNGSKWSLQEKESSSSYFCFFVGLPCLGILLIAPVCAQELESGLERVQRLSNEDPAVAREEIKGLFRLAQRLEDSTSLANCQNLLGAIYISQSKYDSVRFTLQKALELSLRTELLAQEAYSLYLLGTLYWYLEDFELMLSYTKEVQAVLPPGEDPTLQLKIYNQMGNALSSNGMPDSAKT